jgi:methyl-accepting chemotaxis protein
MGLLSRLSIRTKLASMVVFAALTVFAIIAVAASLSASRMQADRVEQMRTAVDMLYGVAQSLQDDVAAGKMTQAEAEAEFRKRGHKMTFNDGQGYPVAYYPDTRLLINAGNPQVEGKITGTKDSNGVTIADAQFAAARQSPAGGIVSYLYPRPGQSVPVRKMAYARHFAPWDVTMSYGLYVDDIDNDVSALRWKLGSIGLGLILMMALVSWLIARDVVSALQRLKARMQHIASGSLDQAVEETGRGDEIGAWQRRWKCCARPRSPRDLSKPSRSLQAA